MSFSPLPSSNSSFAPESIGKVLDEDSASTIRQLSFEFPDHDDAEYDEDEHPGDYNTRMEEVMDDGIDAEEGHEEDEDDEGFIYSGVDSEDVSANYHERLRAVLGPEAESDESEEELEVEKSLLQDGDEDPLDSVNSDTSHGALLSDSILLSSPELPSLPMTPPRIDSPGINGSSYKFSRPFLHPTISRLRSYTPQSSRVPSASGSVATLHSHAFEGISASPSHFSAISPMSSTSNLHQNSRGDSDTTQTEREVFKWTQLRNLGSYIYASTPLKASAVLGSPSIGAPTVLAANGLICVGSDAGRIFVFDFKQTLKCVCGNDSSGATVGPVTALALSHDHTYVASGHASGHIQLFDLHNPQTPARSVLPTTLSAVTSGRQEGHLQGSRIVAIGFVAGRHTAIVSADEHGLAFYHSLGKVLFVDASDVLRILGKYPDEDLAPPSPVSNRTTTPTVSFPSRRRKTKNTIIAMMPLPLGTTHHPTDAYNIVALLTPVKMVIVGLKPSPKTWFKRSRDDDESGIKSRSRKGALSWWPSVLNEKIEQVPKKGQKNGKDQSASTTPALVYSWGKTLHLIRVSEVKIKQATRNARNGKISEVEVGTISFEEISKWTTEDDVLAVQWLNVNQVVVLTLHSLEVYNVHAATLIERVHFDALSLVSPSLSSTTTGHLSYAVSVGDVSHSLRVYRGKIFLLGRQELQVGTLLTWADRILTFVQNGEFLNAIKLTRLYYLDEAPGNRNGLPDDPKLSQNIVGEKMRELMIASTRYAFSEDRMTDGTHFAPDGRGVDRTALFEELVATCARACVALDDFEFFFEDLFQEYDDAGISRIFLLQLEPFILNNEIRYVPPRITQRLIALHEDDRHPDLVERIIWHIDPTCLDINQAIVLCRKHSLYDALIYVYTRALRDYVSPVVELLGLVRQVQRYRKARMESVAVMDDAVMEPIALNAYKIYPYLTNVLSGLTYPSEEPLDEDEAFEAKKDVYTFLFFGRSSMWPLGEGSKLVLTSDEEGGAEPTYPYARLLLQFDAESFLHSLDIVFEDAYLNDESQGVSRLLIVKILLDILSSSTNLPTSDATFVNIFIARNVPKYPQFIQISPSALHNILIGLAEDEDENTREDRQLAAEYLLSVYTPRESERILQLFEKAGFYRILRSWHRQEQKWAPLILTYLRDPDMRSTEAFDNIDDILAISARVNKGTLPQELLLTISDALPQLLHASVTSTALLIDKNLPDLHERALDALGPGADNKRFIYLRYLLGPAQPEEEEYMSTPRKPGPSLKVPRSLQLLFISLQCQYDPSQVIRVLQHMSSDQMDWDKAMSICEENGAYDAVVWAANWRGDPRGALSKAEIFEKKLTISLVDVISNPGQITPREIAEAEKAVGNLESVGKIGVAICLEHSQGALVTELPLEDIWFQLLSSQINCVQNVAACRSPSVSADPNPNATEIDVLEQRILPILRSLVQKTFSSLVSISSTRAVSFPRLFKRLVDTTSPASSSVGTRYTEFRTILTGMLESYRSDGDMLIITKHLLDRDLFETVEEFTRERARGWASSQGMCQYCRKSLLERHNPEETTVNGTGATAAVQVIVSRTGDIYHTSCLPKD